MPDRLAGCGANIEANVHAAIGLGSSEVSLNPTSQIQNSCLLFQRQGEEIWLVASGDDQRMARRHGIGVLERYGQIGRMIVLTECESLAEGAEHRLKETV